MSAATAWVAPTEFSPLCEFKIPRRAREARKLLSNCGMWVTPVERINAALRREQEVGPASANLCPLCKAGRRVREQNPRYAYEAKSTKGT